jgi:hypothetical protein
MDSATVTLLAAIFYFSNGKFIRFEVSGYYWGATASLAESTVFSTAATASIAAVSIAFTYPQFQ